MTKRMRLLIAAVALLLGGSGQADARAPHRKNSEADAKQGLLQIHKQFVAITAKGDADGMAKLIADDYIVTGADGRKADKAGALAAVRQNGAGVRMDEAEVEVRLIGGAGIVTGLINWKAGAGEREASGKVRFTEVWRKAGAGWQLVAAQATNVQEGR